MDGYPQFLRLTLQRWERFVIVQNVSPLVNKEELEAHFSKFGEIERIRFIHNPENGCFMKKALILMKSPRSAADIIAKRYHKFGTDAIPSLDTAIEEIVTTVKYRGRVKMYTHGLYDLHLKLELPWNQDSEDDRTLMGLYLTRLIVRAYRGLIFTTIKLETDSHYMYTGWAIVSFQYKCDEKIVLKRTIEQLKVHGMWDPELDSKPTNTWDDEVAEGASEKVEGDKDGDVLDVEGDEEGSDIRMRKVQTIRMSKVQSSDNSDTWDDKVAEGASEKIEGDEEGDVEGSVNQDEDTGAEGDVEDGEEGSVNWDEDW